MTSQESKKPSRRIRLALIAVFAITLSGALYAACGGGASCTCMVPQPVQGGTGYCSPGPNDCEACRFVVCPGYCVYNGALQNPVFVGDAGCQ